MLKNIANKKGEYTLAQVNCVENPIEIACESYGKYSGIMFLIYIKMYCCYNITIDNSDVNKEYSVLQRIENIMYTDLNIELQRIEPVNFYKTIEDLVDKENPVFVIGNLRELYYSEHYMKSDWIHLFLIKNYDSEKKLFFVVDSVQFRANGVQDYSEFVIPYQIMYDMYESWNNKKGHEDIFYIDSKNLLIEDNPYRLLKTFLQKYLFKKEEQPYVEKTLVEEILNKKRPMSDCKRLMKVYHAKEVMYNELAKMIKICKIEQSLYDEFINTTQELLKEIKLISTKLVYLLCKDAYEEIHCMMDKFGHTELLVEKNLKRIYSAIDNNLLYMQNENDRGLLFENNHDDIISMSENNTYNFCFAGDKVYNYWQQDEAPKMIVCNNLKNNNFEFQVMLELKQYEMSDSFLAGIFIRTNKNAFYIWGANCGLSLLFEKTGVNPNICELFKCKNLTYLKFTSHNGDYYLGYSLDGEVYENKRIDIQLDGQPLEIGIICKTWEKSNQLEFVFSNLKLTM